jgi:DNA polymerase III epsilon subunit-like protein
MAKKYITTFDLETTGKNVEKDKICWICLKKINKETKQIEEVFNRYVNPVIPIESDAEKMIEILQDNFQNYLQTFQTF